MSKKVRLEEAAQKFSDDNSSSPFLFELEPAEGRKLVDEVQSSEIHKYPATLEDKEIDLGELGKINVRFRTGRYDRKTTRYFLHSRCWLGVRKRAYT